MGQRTSIDWCDYSVNPFKLQLPDGQLRNACVKVSAGCSKCYAESIVRRYWPKSAESFPGYSLPLLNRGEPVIDEKKLRWILNCRPAPPFKSPDGRPKFFPFDMTDAFLDFWTDDMLDRFFACVALRPDIDFLVLTKRPERMKAYFDCPDVHRRVLGDGRDHAASISPNALMEVLVQNICSKKNPIRWPPPNLWLGVSVENQEQAENRIPLLKACPAAVRFVSYEPALGRIDFSRFIHTYPDCRDGNLLDWVIIGGESGPGARPFDVQWARVAMAQLMTAGIPCFVKQLGSNPNQSGHPIELKDSKGGKIEEWPEDTRAREFPSVQ